MAPRAGIFRRYRAYRLAALVAASAKTVRRTVSFRILRMLPPCSIPGGAEKYKALAEQKGKTVVEAAKT